MKKWWHVTSISIIPCLLSLLMALYSLAGTREIFIGTGISLFIFFGILYVERCFQAIINRFDAVVSRHKHFDAAFTGYTEVVQSYHAANIARHANFDAAFMNYIEASKKYNNTVIIRMNSFLDHLKRLVTYNTQIYTSLGEHADMAKSQGSLLLEALGEHANTAKSQGSLLLEALGEHADTAKSQGSLLLEALGEHADTAKSQRHLLLEALGEQANTAKSQGSLLLEALGEHADTAKSQRHLLLEALGEQANTAKSQGSLLLEALGEHADTAKSQGSLLLEALGEHADTAKSQGSLLLEALGEHADTAKSQRHLLLEALGEQANTAKSQESLLLEKVTEDIVNDIKFREEIHENIEKIGKSLMQIYSLNEMQINKLSAATNDIINRTSHLVQEEIKSIKESKSSIDLNIEKTGHYLARLDSNNEQHLTKIDQYYVELFGLFNMSQEHFNTSMKRLVESLSGSLQDIQEETKNDMVETIKILKNETRELLLNLTEAQKAFLEDSRKEMQIRQEEIEIVKHIQEEIIGINAKDMELIEKMLNG